MSKQIWIIGAGTFGTRAEDLFKRHCPEMHLTIVDKEPEKIRGSKKDRNRIICGDGIDFLSEHLGGKHDPDWIVPAIPRHVAFEWLIKSLKPAHRSIPIEIPSAIVSLLPNAMAGSKGAVYFSNADFICPVDCLEPESICPCTEKPRPRILHRYLSGIAYENYRSIVIQSHQLAPGVGGYSPHALYVALNRARGNADSPILLSTACKCHGAMHAFRLTIDS